MAYSNKELLLKVNSDGISITDNTLRNLIRYGLILSNKKGYKRGVPPKTYYHPSDVKALQNIHALKQTYKATSWENMIFLLFCKGHKIHTEKLQSKLVQFVNEMSTNFEFIAKNPDKTEDAIFILSEQPNSKSLPDQRTPEEYEAEQQYRLIVRMIKDISTAKGIPNVYMLTFLNRMKILGLPDFQKTFQEHFGHFDLSKLRKSVHTCEESDLHRIQQIIINGLDLWSEISMFYPNPGQVPIFGKLIVKLQDQFKTTDLFSKPDFLQLIIVCLIHISNTKRIELLAFLLNQTYRKRIIKLFSCMRPLSTYFRPNRLKVKK
ncbi:hypothetical protein LOZ80_33180 [Paenibacillus sp. HWE-109]|uniref:hypothetical protein n=1 Tax=Paenibacillus sp. HWE-109 TaxID=1306526 RepID=UPI001EDE31E5|nr:hypothetical protein [Paenibacillus sp. HWE-109]UKS26325.1 hypothetical protein LOZ80_33180 [Paenibacillus sp. HWE-109]